MSKPNLNHIAEVRKAKGWSQQQLADAVGAHWITISKLERGKMQLTQSWVERLAEALDVDPFKLVNFEYKFPHFIDINGRILERGAVKPLQQAQVVPLEDSRFNDSLSVWLEFEGDAAYPYFKGGDVIRFISVDETDAAGFAGHLCLVQPDKSGKDESRIVGYLEIGPKGDAFTIRPIIGKPHVGIEICSLMIAYEVRFMMPWEAS